MWKKIRTKIRGLLLILLCWGAIMSIMYLLIAQYLLWPITALMPVSSQFALGYTGYPLLQYTKKELLPKHYILITGDSYAYGAGEYFYDNIKQKKLQYHAGHTLHTLTSRDVIVLGFPHMGNIDDLAIIPTTFIEKIQNKYGYSIEDPEFILAFFYEGNDLANNVEDLEYQYPEFNYVAGAGDNGEIFLELLGKKIIDDQNAPDETTGSLLADFLAGIVILSDHVHPPRRIYGPDSPGSINKIVQNEKVMAIPDRLEPMGMFLSDHEFLLGTFVFENSLKVLQKRYPHSKIGVIYIPSPLSSYKIASPEVSVFVHTMTRQQEVFYPASRVNEMSNKTCSAIQQIVQAQHVGFMDARPHFREIGQTTQLHGSKDWNHPNHEGYIALGEVAHMLFQQLNSGAPPSSCENL
jgi:hypothetical protein